MELTESIETLNQRLVDHFGVDTSTSQPIWRVSWSDDQFEHRYGTYTDYTKGGLFIRTVTEVRYVPKYQWIRQKHILEQLVAVPFINALDLPDTKVSYEVMWVFMDKNDNPLPPKWEPIKFVIDSVNAARYANHNLARYKDPGDGKSSEELANHHKNKIDGIVEELFGDESGLMGTTFNESSSAIFVPQNYKRGE